MKRLPLIAGAIAASSFSCAAAARPMTPQDLLKIGQVSELSIAPDGQRIAIGVRSLPDIHEGAENGPAKTQLEVAVTAGSTQQFLPENMDISAIKFSPDGRQIGFLWEPDEKDAKTALYAIPVGGGGHQKLVALEKRDITDYIWGNDSNSAYLLATAPVDEDREAQSKAGFDAVVYEEEDRFKQVLRASGLGREKPKLSTLSINGQPGSMRLSPDGRRLAVGVSPTTLVDDSYTSQRVQIIDAESGKQQLVLQTPGKIGDFEFAPDGASLSLIAAVDKHDPAPTTLHIVDASTGFIRAVNAGAAEATIDTEWLADGRLAVLIHRGVQSELRYYDADGTLLTTIDPGSLILRQMETNGSDIAFVADAPQHPRELYRLSGSSFSRWSNSNPWLSQIDMGRQRAFSYTARDGQQIEGVLLEPVGGARIGSTKKGGAPTIFDVHGGPEAHESNGWITNYGGPGQIAAGQGYAVFLPNYRGSTAYGTAFSKQHQSDYAGKEFNDLVDAIKPLAASGVTDAERVGITGGSYGGYASGWAATALSEYFAASVMFVGISNQISKFGTTDIPNEMFLVHSRKWPWQDWQGMLEVSPIYHVDKANTPILILHGENDTRVAPSQSYELYRNLKVRKPEVPARLILYPGEGHGNRNAAARFDYNRRMMRWFDTYLKPGKRSGALPPTRFDLPAGFLNGEAGDDEK